MTPTAPANPSLLRSLRSLIPTRDCEPDEALQIAEAQATRLVQHLRTQHTRTSWEGVEIHHLAALPRIRVVYEDLPVSGMSHWNGTTWIITINAGDPPTRQRFTALHEFHHIICHGHTQHLFNDTKRGRTVVTAEEQAERAADYFAGCALVPKRDLKHAWVNGRQRLTTLADHFGVSHAAMTVRLDQTGIARETDPEPPTRQPRCARPTHTPRTRPQGFVIAQRHRRYV